MITINNNNNNKEKGKNNNSTNNNKATFQNAQLTEHRHKGAHGN